MKVGFFLLGIALTLVFALIQLPTRFAVSLLPSMPAITLSDPTGSVWQGGVCVNSQLLPEKACINWNWQAKQVLSGDWAWDAIAATGDVRSNLVARVNTTAWQVNGALTTPAGQAIPQWAAWLPAGKTQSEKKIDFSGFW